MIGLLITCLVFILLWFLPIGVKLAYHQDGGVVWLKFWFVKVKLYPKPQKEQDENSKSTKSETARKNSAENSQESKLAEYIPIVNIVLDFLSDFRRKLWVQNFEFKLMLAGDDPADLAVLYGNSWAALGGLFPQLERYVKIKRRNLEVLCDFTSSKTKLTAHADILITLGDFLIICLRHGNRGLKEYFKLSKKIKAVQ